MTQKEQILELLKGGVKTQRELAERMQYDEHHVPNIYGSLMSLVRKRDVIRTGKHPSYYSLPGTNVVIITKKKKNSKKNKEPINIKITNDLLDKAHNKVKSTDSYGKEDDLITECFKRFPKNTDRVVVAMKIGLIDITNSTNISRHKRYISVVELVDCIMKIENIDERIKNGDPEVVNEIARSNGKINLFSFATKYCCYHNKNLYGKDDYAIVDTIIKENLYRYFDDLDENQVEQWQNNYQYKEFNDYITHKLDELNITTKFRKRKFDHFIWYTNRKKLGRK